MRKICFRCNIEKDLSDFYVHKRMADGHLNKCKQCTKDDSNARYNELIIDPEWHRKEQERGRDKYRRYKYKSAVGEKKKVIMNRYVNKYPEKVTARKLMGNIKPPIGFNLHHWSYDKSKAKDVILLKIADHYLIHRFLIYDQESMMYKTLAGELLDTREKHETYINKIISDHVAPA